MLDTLLSIFLDYGYIAVFFILLLCGMGVPIPEDITLVAGGVIAGVGSANVHVMVVVCYLGVMTGDLIMFCAGYFFNDRLRQSRWFSKLLNESRMAKIDRLYARYGNRVLFMVRFMPGVRSAAYVMAGMNHRISIWRFLLIDGMAALVSVPIWVYLGEYGAENREWLLRVIDDFKWVLAGVIAIAVGAWFSRRFFKKRRLNLLLSRRAKRSCNQKHRKIH